MLSDDIVYRQSGIKIATNQICVHASEGGKILYMTIANELSADVATAILLNMNGNRRDLLKIIEKVHLELRRLSLEGHPVSLQRERAMFQNEIQQNPDVLSTKGFNA
jgi:hypothetical protein